MTTNDRNLPKAKLAIDLDYATWGNDVRGVKKQCTRVWENFTTSDGDRFCVVCGDQVDRKDRVAEKGCSRGEWHHIIPRSDFPAPYEVREGTYSMMERKSKHHVANGVIVCTSCHGLLEGFQNGRPHIASWLYRDLTGQEIPLVLPAESQARSSQRRDWIQAQYEAERAGEYECTACDHVQQEEVTKPVYDGDEYLFQYTGRDVRAVHVLPPEIAPELIHDPSNLILLCWECLFGVNERSSEDDPALWAGWKDEPPAVWAETFAPHRLGEYADRFDSRRNKRWG